MARLVSMAVLAASLALCGLSSTVQGRLAYWQQVAPVVAQYQEVLSWAD
jgi:hypothetical protein